VNCYKIFIASPSDVKKEREVSENAIADIDRVCRATIGLRVECFKWEHLPPLTPSLDNGDIEDVILREQVQKCNVFVLILYKRYGSTALGHTTSNTEREVDVALKLLEQKPNLMILSYFRKLQDDPDPGDQEQKIKELKKRLTDRKLWYKEYASAEDFRLKLIHDLYYVSLRFQTAVTKQRSLRAFWELSSVEEQGTPKVAIIYPPLDRSSMKTMEPDHIWLERLVPNMVFEDSKAINKVEKTLRLIGHHQINTYTTVSFPHAAYDMNRVWLCLPRNIPGVRQMAKYEDETLFRFEPRHGKTEGKIFWKFSDKIGFSKVQSPLSKYLQLQRHSIPGGEWTHNHGRIIAKDYAIIGRFTDKRESRLKDYFIAGVRGLGTWGAGWFLDRRYKAFLKWENQDEKPIQLLLEVIYKNEHIHEVRDVSNMPRGYFEAENNIDTIRKHIKELQDR
jgi:hypothetical protein